jgi:protein NrfD
MHDQFWGGSIALDLYFGGIGVGTFLFAVMLSFFYGEKCQLACKVAALVTPISVAFGFLFLIGHLGHPERFYLVYTKVRLTSPIWWGAWFQALFSLISIAYAWMWWKNPDNPRKKILGYIGVPFALAVGVYHGFVLMVFKSKPLWNTGPTTVTAICGFIMTGIALVVLIMSLMTRENSLLEELKISRNIMGAAIAVQLLTLALWVSSLYFGTGESHVAMLRLVQDYGGLFWGVAVIVGLALPLVIGAAAIVHEKNTGRFSYAVPLITSLMVLVGGFAVRYVVIVAA